MIETAADQKRRQSDLFAFFAIQIRERQHRQCKKERTKEQRGMVGGGRGSKQHRRLEKRAPVAVTDPFIKKWQRVQIDGSRSGGAQLARGINQKTFRAKKHRGQRRVGSRARADPELGKAINAHNEQKNGGELHGHIGHFQPEDRRQRGDPLLRKRRIGGLRKARVPLRIPRIEPVVQVVRGKEDMEVRVVGLQAAASSA